MTDKPRDYEQELADIVNAVAESTLELTAEEIELEIKDEGLDPEAVAMQVRELLTNAVKSCQQRLLVEAEERYKQSINAIKGESYFIPESASAQRELINSILASNPQLGRGFLTAQSRDFASLPDEDLRGFIIQLMNLVKANDAVVEDAKE
jgi:hypothetical protein